MNKKKTIIICLLGLVVCLGIGFAAFSTTLKINGKAKVSPNEDNFKFFFVSSVNSVSEYSTEDFYGIASSGIVEPGEGHFEDDTTFINTGLTFTEDGQSVDYKFYILNAGKYDAHITNLDIGKKTCTPGEDADPTLAASACNSINLSVILGDEGNQTTYTSSQAIEDHVLPKGTWEQIIVRISYPEGSPLADGDLEVTWEDISFLTATTASYTPPKPESNMQILSGDLETIGSEVAIGTEHFYVIGNNEDDSSKVNLLAKYNLLLGKNYSENWDTDESTCEGNGGEWIEDKDSYCVTDKIISTSTEGYNRQSANALGEISDEYVIYDDIDDNEIVRFNKDSKNSSLSSLTPEQISIIGYVENDSDNFNSSAILPFSENAYWVDGDLWSYKIKSEYGTNYDEIPFVYDSNSSIYQYIDNYKHILENTYNITITEARLLSVEEIVDLGCDMEKRICLTSEILNNNRNWLFTSTYWLGNVSYPTEIAGIRASGEITTDDYYKDFRYGVRPIITISKSDIA